MPEKLIDQRPKNI